MLMTECLNSFTLGSAIEMFQRLKWTEVSLECASSQLVTLCFDVGPALIKTGVSLDKIYVRNTM